MTSPLLIHLPVSTYRKRVDLHSALILFSRPTNPSVESPYPGIESVKSMTLLELPRDKIAEDGCNAVTKTEPRPLSSQICLEPGKGTNACSDLFNTSVKSGSPD
jgi:hypothetical protein